MPETRLTRALLTATIAAIAFVVVVVGARIVTWLMGEDARLWGVLVLVALVGFALQWFLDRPQ